MKFLVTNVQGTKGIILDANEAHEAKELATDYFYSPFTRKKDLTVVQAYEMGKHLFVTASGNKRFKKVQFNSMGGVTTTYNCTIDTQPTEQQINFLNNPIVYVLFSDHDSIPGLE